MLRIQPLPVIAFILALSFGLTSSAMASTEPAKPRIQVAVLLDTSNSMDGLINQAKSQLWKLVNELSRAKRAGQSPQLEVALYEYGNDGLPASEGHIRQVSGFTDDLDQISEQLFALKTNGGNEFCGQVIDRATEQLEWDSNPKTLKVVFIAGNEPFTQGEVDYRKATRKAIAAGIVVNTIFCGPADQGRSTGWREGAMLADGRYTSIDHNAEVVHIAAPQDDEIARLGEELNKTYVAYGRKGKQKKARQMKQDSNAKEAKMGASVQRAVTKASKAYKNKDWDLVDAAAEGAPVAAVPLAELPAEMQEMSEPEREEFVEKKGKDRAQLKAKIQKLQKEREKFVEGEMKKKAKSGVESFDEAVIDALHEQAKKKSFSFE